MTHTERDSLLYLRHSVNHLLNYAQETIAGVHTENASDDLPDHIEEGLEMLRTVEEIINYEAAFHNADDPRLSYSTGQPVTFIEQHPYAEPQDDGTTRIVFHDMHTAPYPDGGRAHPTCRAEFNKENRNA